MAKKIWVSKNLTKDLRTSKIPAYIQKVLISVSIECLRSGGQFLYDRARIMRNISDMSASRVSTAVKKLVDSGFLVRNGKEISLSPRYMSTKEGFKKGKFLVLFDTMLKSILKKKIISSLDLRCTFALIEKIIGWHKESDWVSASQIAQMIGYEGDLRNITRSISRLVKAGVLFRKGKELAFHTGLWITSESCQNDTKGCQNDTQKVTKMTHTKLSLQNLKTNTLLCEPEKNFENPVVTTEHREIAEQKEIQDVGLEVRKFLDYNKSRRKPIFDFEAGFRLWLTRHDPNFGKTKSSKAKAAKQKQSDKAMLLDQGCESVRDIESAYAAMNAATIRKIKKDFEKFTK